MAQTIKLKRSATQGATPATSALELGEVAINTYDGKMFIKKDDGSESIVEIGASSGIANVVEDTTPQLGGNLDLNSSNITGTGNIDITGTVTIDGLTVGDGTGSEQILVDAGAGWADLKLNSDATNGGSIYFNDGADAGQIFYYHPDNSMRFHTDATERMRIDSSGNVGIGTTSPSGTVDVNGNVLAGGQILSSSAKLQVNGFQRTGTIYLHEGTTPTANNYPLSTTSGGELRWNGNKVWHAGNDGSGSGLDADTVDGLQASQFLRSDANDSSSYNIQASNFDVHANHGHGLRFWNGSDSYRIYMSSYSVSGAGRVSGETTSDYNMYFRMTGGTNRGFVFQSGTSNKAGIDASGNARFTGNVTAYASDERLKENIKPIENPLDKLSKIRGVTYDWKDNIENFDPKCKTETGVIAQEIEAVIPDAISPAPFNEEYKTVEKDKIIALLIEAVKELKAEVDELKASK